MRYFFLLDANIQATDKNNNQEFKAGKSYELDKDVGDKFVKRGAAKAEKQSKVKRSEAREVDGNGS